MLPTYILLGLPMCGDGPQPQIEVSELGPAFETWRIFIMQIDMNIYILEVYGPSRTRLLAGASSGLLDFVLHGHRPFRPCDPRNGAVFG